MKKGGSSITFELYIFGELLYIYLYFLILIKVSHSCFLTSILQSVGELTAEVWRESVREDSEGRQTATEPSEPARELLGPPPLPSSMVALVKATWSKLCDWWKEGKQGKKKRKRKKKKKERT